MLDEQKVTKQYMDNDVDSKLVMFGADAGTASDHVSWEVQGSLYECEGEWQDMMRRGKGRNIRSGLMSNHQEFPRVRLGLEGWHRPLAQWREK